MNNDYYLQEISGKLSILDNTIENQTTQIVSGDNTIINTLNTKFNYIIEFQIMIIMAIVLKIIWDFCVRCWK